MNQQITFNESKWTNGNRFHQITITLNKHLRTTTLPHSFPDHPWSARFRPWNLYRDPCLIFPTINLHFSSGIFPAMFDFAREIHQEHMNYISFPCRILDEVPSVSSAQWIPVDLRKTYLGESITDEDFASSKSLLSWAQQRFPASAVFEFWQTELHVIRTEVRQASVAGTGLRWGRWSSYGWFSCFSYWSIKHGDFPEPWQK